MTPQEAIEVLKQYNAWRRDRNDINQHEMPDVAQIGIAIDTIVHSYPDNDTLVSIHNSIPDKSIYVNLSREDIENSLSYVR
jgi:hypothetical protein